MLQRSRFAKALEEAFGNVRQNQASGHLIEAHHGGGRLSHCLLRQSLFTSSEATICNIVLYIYRELSKSYHVTAQCRPRLLTRGEGFGATTLPSKKDSATKHVPDQQPGIAKLCSSYIGSSGQGTLLISFQSQGVGGHIGTSGADSQPLKGPDSGGFLTRNGRF